MSRLKHARKAIARTHPLAQSIAALLIALKLSSESAVALMPKDLVLNPRTLDAFLAGEKSPTSGTARKLNALEVILKRRTTATDVRPANLKRDGALFRTAMLRELLNWLDYAWKNPGEQVYLLTVKWGVGKTAAIEYWRKAKRQKPHWYLEVPPGITRGELIERMHNELGLPPVPKVWKRLEAVIAELRAHPRMLIIDQAEELSVSTINTIQYLWDQTHIPLVLLAAPTLVDRLYGARTGQNIGRIRRRIFHVPLPELSPEEVAGIYYSISPHKFVNGAFQYFLERTGYGCTRQVLAGAGAVAQVMKASGKKRSDPVTTKALEVALRHLI